MNARDQMKTIDGQLARIDAEMAKLLAQKEILLAVRQEMTGEIAEKPTRKRSVAIKPLVIDIMHAAGFTGATTAEVDAMVRRDVPTVAKDTVGSILSRLKSDGALTYEGERYYEKQFAPAPKPTVPFEGGMRVVN
jgi:hypothetical protein